MLPSSNRDPGTEQAPPDPDPETAFLASGDIIVRMRAGSPEAETEFFQLFAPPVDMEISCFVCDEQRPGFRARLQALRIDLLQEVMMEASRLVRAANFEYRGVDALRSYIRHLAKSRFIDRVRRLELEPEQAPQRSEPGATTYLSAAPHQGSGVITQIAREEDRTTVRLALERLDRRHERIVRLHYYWGLGWPAVCEEIGGKSPDAVRVECERVRDRLAVEIQRVRAERRGETG